ncbi:hypothetical protein Csa_015155, partial [Cucumis sativus]
ALGFHLLQYHVVILPFPPIFPVLNYHFALPKIYSSNVGDFSSFFPPIGILHVSAAFR